ncbi:protein D1-like [Planococcus citri]|uniref:protein D1-like n=1 Tax=Planococcus citri TaxID=170843 RepID=UPI0031FA07AB
MPHKFHYYIYFILANLQVAIFAKHVGELFWDTGVMPEIFKIAPIELLQVTYPYGQLTPGDTLKPEHVVTQPTLSWSTEKDVFYTMFMTGVETPCLPRDTIEEDLGVKVNEWEQWMVINIPEQNIQEGKCLFEYIPPHSPNHPNKTNHYSFLMFKQMYYILEYLDFGSTGVTCLEDISVLKFVRRHHLGEPICGNLFSIPFIPGLPVWNRTTRPPLTVEYPGTFTYPTFNIKDMFTKISTNLMDKQHAYVDDSDVEKGLFL